MKFCLNCARLVSRTQLYSIKYTHCISRASEFIPYVSWQEFNEEHWDAFIVCERYRDKRPATLDGPVWEFLHCITLLYDLNEFSISGYLLASYPGSCGGGEKRAWYRPFAHALNYKLKNHVYVANDV